jgi:cytosine/adenosine deaminase-related metal-dependent hydrolase
MAHVAESPAEDALVRRGTGRLVSLAKRLAPDFETPGTGTVAYLDSLGILEDLIAIHAVQVDQTDIELLAEKARGVVLCPRSNLYLDCGAPPVRELREAGVAIALGTDSIASNRDFDLFEEARALREIDPKLTAETLLESMTSAGARLLGLDGHGVLAAGGPADMTVLLLGGTDQPVRDVIGTARRKDVAAVMSAGVWRWRRERR